ncbi:phage tail tip lysozyme [Gluconacetobacter diazotrophicus]|uniref:phage tail tip lysozyme n=1 Tax=Gluconacetobacter diazotrophicus TaxID=33996 RepID=UPI00119A48C7|nr:phage tail tip lysozyme [Gluconacetobacter diazotrophicus]TWA98248.1 hypothetical protein FBZ86_1477 [Gluconacetobacter diazotrophicus]
MAGQGNYSITIKAVDAFSSVLKNYNNQMKGAQQPMRRLQSQLKQFNNLSGIRNLSNNFTELTGRIRLATDGAVNLFKQLTAIGGVASLAGAAVAMNAAGEAANRARLTGNQLGIGSAQVLQQRAQSRILGVSEDTMTNTYGGMQETARQVANGQNADAQQIMQGAQSAGFNMSTRNDPNANIQAFLQYARREQTNGMDMATLRKQFSTMGVSQDLMGIDPSKVQAAGDAAQRLSRLTQQGVDSLQRFNESSRIAREAITGLGMAMAERVAPALSGLIDRFSQWIQTSPQVVQITNEITNAAISLSNWIQNIPFDKVYNDLQPILPSFQTLKTIVESLIALKVGGWVLGVVGSLGRLGISLAITTARVAGLVVSLGANLLGALGSAGSAMIEFVASGRAVEMGMAAVRLALVATRTAFTLATGPIGIAVAAISLAAYEIYEHWSTFRPYFEALWNRVKAIFNGAVAAIKPITSEFIGVFETMWGGIKSIFGKAWDYVSPIFDKMQKAIGWAVDHIPGLNRAVGAAKTAAHAVGTATHAIASAYQDITVTQAPASNEPAIQQQDNAVTHLTPDGKGSFAPPPSQPIDYSQASNVTGRLQQLGLNRAAAIGAAANIMQESRFNPNAVGDNGAAFGIGQWHRDRQNAIEGHFGIPLRNMSMDQQLQAYVWEMGTGNGGNVRNRLAGVTDAGQAAAMISRDFERPAATSAEMARRSSIAMNIQQGLSNQNNSLFPNMNVSQAPVSYAMNNVPTAVNDQTNVHVSVSIDDNARLVIKTSTNNGTVRNPLVVGKKPIMSGTLAYG